MLLLAMPFANNDNEHVNKVVAHENTCENNKSLKMIHL